MRIHRRDFLKGSALAALTCAGDLSFLLGVSQAAAADTSVDPDLIRFGPDLDPIIALIQDTPRERCIPVFKASQNPHDLKYPAAAFEDAYAVSPEWRPYLLASSVHALHGAKSEDAKVLLQAREALR